MPITILERRCGSFAAGALMVIAAATLADAQGVTLPSIRVAGPSAEVRLLNRSIAAGRALYDTSSNDASTKTKALTLHRALDRLSLSAVSAREFGELQRAITSGDSARILSGAQLGRNDQQVLPAFRALFSQRGSTRVDSVPEVSEFETGTLLATLRDSETDKTRSAILDTISMAARAVVIERKLKNRWRFPVRSREHAKAFWRQPDFSTLNVGALSAGTKGGASFTEIASPFLHALRVSVNAVLATDKSDESTAEAPPAAAAAASAAEEEPSKTAITRFVNGGGLINLGFAYPAAYIAAPNGALSMMVLAVPRFGATIPALGASQRDTTLMYDAGLEFHVKSVDLTDGVGIFLQTRAAWAGGTSKFGSLLGVDNGKNNFGYSTLSTGFSFGGRYLITASRTLSGPRTLRDLGWQVGLTALRGPAS